MTLDSLNMQSSEYDASGELSGSAGLMIPVRDKAHGEATLKRLRRFTIIYAILFVFGIVPALFGANAAVQALGMGLMWPGAGFLASGSFISILLTLVLFAAALIFWFGAGNIMAPILVWFGAAFLAAMTTGEYVASYALAVSVGTIVALVLYGVITSRSTQRQAITRAQSRNRMLVQVKERPINAQPADNVLQAELSEEQLAAARYVLDRALQPLDQFDGFDFIDQFQTASVRYQLNFASYGLSVYQSQYAPNFHGYLSLAQRNLIEKVQDKKIWSYWRWENLWGNLDPNPDPIPNDNIMYSGYLGLMIGLYQSASGDDQYDHPDAISLKWDDQRTFTYDYSSIESCVFRNFQKADLGLFPCEPNWIYSACNLFGALSLKVYDRLHDHNYYDQISDLFEKSIESDFTTLDGRIVAIRSSLTGFTIPSLTSTMADSESAVLAHPLLPDLAERTWHIMRSEFLDIDDDGYLKAELRGWDKIDVGNYKRSEIGVCMTTLGLAREMGDEKLAQASLKTLEDKYGKSIRDGVLRYESGSNNINIMIFLKSLLKKNWWREVILNGPPKEVFTGPLLHEVPYPDVLVARARSHGEDLDLVLYPGQSSGISNIKLARLKAGIEYQVKGSNEKKFTANSRGEAEISLHLEGRTPVMIEPLG